MSIDRYRRQLLPERKQRIDAEAKAGEYRTKEPKKRAEADKARQEAGRSKNASTIRMKLKRADQRDKEAATAGEQANKWLVSCPTLYYPCISRLRRISTSAAPSSS